MERMVLKDKPGSRVLPVKKENAEREVPVDFLGLQWLQTPGTPELERMCMERLE